MADTEPDVLEDGAPKKKSPMVLIIIMVNVLLIGGAAAFFLLRGGGGAGGGGAAEAEKLGKLVPVESFIVNLNEPRSTRYLKVTFTVELADDSAEEALRDRKDLVRDRVLTSLSGLSIDDVRGSETKETIRQMLIGRINEAVARENAIKNVLFTEFVVQ